MGNQIVLEDKEYHPIGKFFATLTKQYIGVVSEKLKKMDIERYWYVIMIIAEQENDITQKELGELLGHDKATVVRIIDYLANHGYVQRKQNTEDRRAYFVLLTPKAKKALPNIKNAFQEANNAALKGLKKEQLLCFRHCLETIQSNLQALPSTSVNLNFKKTKK
jgi:DNA-binding MarR family transcriptional regulator